MRSAECGIQSKRAYVGAVAPPNYPMIHLSNNPVLAGFAASPLERILEQTFQAVYVGRHGRGVQGFLDEFYSILNGADGFGQERAGGIGVAAALKSGRDFQRVAIAAAKARKNGVAPAEQRHEHGIFRDAGLE